MSLDLDELLLKLKWEEEGQALPAGARAQLQSLVQAQQALTAANDVAAQSATRLGNAFQASRAGWASQSQILQAMQKGEAARVASLGAGAASLGEAVQRTGQHFAGASRSVGMLRTGLSLYAFQAVGATGVTSRLAQGLLMFSAGGVVTLGVVAGLAVVGGAFQLVTKSAREANAQLEKALELARTIAQQQPGAGQQPRLELLGEALTRSTVDRNRQAAEMRRQFGEDFFEREPQGQAEQAIRAQFVEKERIIGILRDAMRDILDTVGDEIAKAVEADREKRLADLQAEFAESRRAIDRAREIAAGGGGGRAVLRVGQFLTRSVTGFSPEAIQRTGAQAIGASQAVATQLQYAQALDFTRGVLVRTLSPQQIFTQGLSQLQLMLDLGEVTTEEFSAAVKQLTEDMERAKKTAPQVGVAVIGMISGAIAAAIQGGSATSIIGGILGTVGGIVGIANPLLGAGIAGLGTIISATGNRGVTIDRYGETALTQLRGMPSGPERIEFSIISSTTGEIIERVIQRLGDRRRTDAVSRVPLILVAG